MPGKQREVTLRFLAEPADVNFGGKVFGGAVMQWIDHAGYACAAGWAGQYCVTASVGGIQFERPILIGQLVEVSARILLTGRSSMHVAVDVRSRDPRVDGWEHATHCLMVFVAIDSAGRPTPVPTWQPLSAEDRAEADYAERMKVLAVESAQEFDRRQRHLASPND